MLVRWLTAFIDRPAPTFDVARDFWLTATATTLSPVRGAKGQFATLLPADGDAHLRVQRVDDGPGGCHLDLHVGDIAAGVDEAITLGARVARALDDVTLLQSPAGLRFCLVAHHGEAVRSAPTPLAGTGTPRTIVDQLCLDVPAMGYERECAFWAALTGWQHRRTGRDELSFLVRPPGLPLRLLLQRLGPDDTRADATAHLDLACDDVAAAVVVHERLGARVAHAFGPWTAMADPSGLPYCLTSRDPDTGLAPT